MICSATTPKVSRPSQARPPLRPKRRVSVALMKSVASSGRMTLGPLALPPDCGRAGAGAGVARDGAGRRGGRAVGRGRGAGGVGRARVAPGRTLALSAAFRASRTDSVGASVGGAESSPSARTRTATLRVPRGSTGMIWSFRTLETPLITSGGDKAHFRGPRAEICYSCSSPRKRNLGLRIRPANTSWGASEGRSCDHGCESGSSSIRSDSATKFGGVCGTVGTWEDLLRGPRQRVRSGPSARVVTSALLKIARAYQGGAPPLSNRAQAPKTLSPAHRQPRSTPGEEARNQPIPLPHWREWYPAYEEHNTALVGSNQSFAPIIGVSVAPATPGALSTANSLFIGIRRE